eukprot:13392206-Alexandrium_andersonii.AAC.1
MVCLCLRAQRVWLAAVGVRHHPSAEVSRGRNKLHKSHCLHLCGEHACSLKTKVARTQDARMYQSNPSALYGAIKRFAVTAERHFVAKPKTHIFVHMATRRSEGANAF